MEVIILSGSTINLYLKHLNQMNHYALLIKVMDVTSLSKFCEFSNLEFSMSESCVRWGGQYSYLN